MQVLSVSRPWYSNASSFILPISWRKFTEIDQDLQLNWKSNTNYLIIACEWTKEYLGV